MIKRFGRFFAQAIAFSSFISAFCASAFPQTVRGKAEERFGEFGWTEKADTASASSGAANRSPRRLELAGNGPEGEASLSQDTGSFPLAPIAALSASAAVPPILPGAGALDFSAAPPALISLFSDIAASLKTRDYSAIKAAASSPFIPVMLEYMTRRLPQVKDAAFAGIEIAADGKSARAILRLRLAESADAGDGFEDVFAVAEAVLEDGEWRAVDVIFEDESYGKAARQAGT